ncbi:MAG: family 1 glycosylhydrolase [Bacteroidota bacterium]
MNVKEFPKGFVWGTSTSSYQIEGAPLAVQWIIHYIKRVSIFSLTLILMFSSSLFAQPENEELIKINHQQFDIVTHKMHIIPGMWRPMFESEQVAWISPPWESQEYVWFDFPEAIWVEGNLAYLGHIDRRFPTLFPTEKSVPWRKLENGIVYEQVLPNGVSFGGEITRREENIAELKLWITNGSENELKDVMLLTCVYLDGIKEFNEKTNENKYVHTPDKGWLSFPDTEGMQIVTDGWRVGWLNEGAQVSDLPVVVVKSKVERHILALTWFDDTYSFIGNLNHPCVHADPVFNNLKPGESQTISGELIFFEGSLEEFEIMFKERYVLAKTTE